MVSSSKPKPILAPKLLGPQPLDAPLRIIGPHHLSALEALASPLSERLTLSATRHRLNLVRDRMKNALDALEQALISQGLSTTT
jgi:hypothetical protein